LIFEFLISGKHESCFFLTVFSDVVENVDSFFFFFGDFLNYGEGEKLDFKSVESNV